MRTAQYIMKVHQAQFNSSLKLLTQRSVGQEDAAYWRHMWSIKRGFKKRDPELCSANLLKIIQLP
jgi:hypothetical protein